MVGGEQSTAFRRPPVGSQPGQRNGPENSGARTQFLYRLVRFADATGLEVKLVYYPPYHSKYNRIEHCWGILENHWNGTLLNSVHTVVEWARTMTWNGVQPVVTLIEKTYDKGVRIAKAAFKAVESRLQRDKILPKYEILIQPQSI
ncbi:MAG: ISAzo13-like element transposase-related protein [Isosphaeraceae bacterium]